jgi:hypothetical protein
VSENERMCSCASVFVFVFVYAVGTKTKALRCARMKSLCILSRERGSSEGEKRKEKTTFRKHKLCSENESYVQITMRITHTSFDGNGVAAKQFCETKHHGRTSSILWSPQVAPAVPTGTDGGRRHRHGCPVVDGAVSRASTPILVKERELPRTTSTIGT